MLQRDIVQRLHGICDELVGDLGPLYEPLWDAPNNTMLLRQAILQGKVIFL